MTDNLAIQSENIGKLATALCAAQAEFPAAKKTKTNPHLKKKYADLGDILEAVQPTLTKHGLAVAQISADAGVVTMLMHAESGEWLRSVVPVFEGNQKGAQGYGSGFTYARRYGLSGILNIVADDDDDGHAASGQGARRANTEPEFNARICFDYLKDTLPKATDMKAWKDAHKKSLGLLLDADKSLFDNLMDLGKKRAGDLMNAPLGNEQQADDRTLVDDTIPF